MYTVTTTRWTLLIYWLCQAGWSEGQYILHEFRCSFDLVNCLGYAIAYTFFAFTPVCRFKPMVHKPWWYVGWMEKHRLAIITKWYFWWFLGALILSRAVPFISFWYGMHHMSWVLVSVTPVATLISDVFITHVYDLTMFLTHLPSATYMRQWIRLALVKIMACCLLGGKPLSKSMLDCFQFDR